MKGARQRGKRTISKDAGWAPASNYKSESGLLLIELDVVAYVNILQREDDHSS